MVLKSNQIDTVSKEFQVETRKNYLLIYRSFKVGKVVFWLTISFFLRDALCTLGMGKRVSFVNSIDDAIDENIMVRTSLRRYLGTLSSDQINKSMSQEEMDYFLKIAQDRAIRRSIKILIKKASIEKNTNQELINIPRIQSFDVTAYLPIF